MAIVVGRRTIPIDEDTADTYELVSGIPERSVRIAGGFLLFEETNSIKLKSDDDDLTGIMKFRDKEKLEFDNFDIQTRRGQGLYLVLVDSKKVSGWITYETE